MSGFTPIGRTVVALAAQQAGMSGERITSPARDAEVVQVRDRAITVLKTLRPDLSLAHVGRVFNRDRTSIYDSLQRYDKRRAGDLAERASFNKLLAAARGTPTELRAKAALERSKARALSEEAQERSARAEALEELASQSEQAAGGEEVFGTGRLIINARQPEPESLPHRVARLTGGRAS